MSVGDVTSAEQLGGASIGCVPFSGWIPPTELIAIDVAALRANVEELGWPAFDGMQDDRLAGWSATIDAGHLTTDEVAAGMDLLTQVLSVRPEESVDFLWVRELMARRGHLCALLPTEHPYRGGEYCD